MCIGVVGDARPIEILKLLQKKSVITLWETWNGNGMGGGASLTIIPYVAHTYKH